MCGGLFGGNDAAEKAAEEARRKEELRRRNIEQGTLAIDDALAPFDDTFFDGRRLAFVNNSTPQLDDQFRDAQEQLIFALSRTSNLNSSLAADKQRALNEERARFEADINSSATQFANQGRSDLEQTRTNLISQLNATENPTLAADEAARQAGLIGAEPTFDPVGNFLFNTAVNLENLNQVTTGGRGLANRGPTSNLGLGGGSSRVVRS